MLTEGKRLVETEDGTLEGKRSKEATHEENQSLEEDNALRTGRAWTFQVVRSYLNADGIRGKTNKDIVSANCTARDSFTNLLHT